jgi:hypothetical protein
MFKVRPLKKLCVHAKVYLSPDQMYDAIGFASGAIIHVSEKESVFMRNLRDYFEIIM